MIQISFGTDGWRGVIARDFTFDNVELVAQAVAMYINNHRLAGRGVVVGYDNRFLSDRFARTAADVLNDNGIKVYALNGPVPTPVAAFAIKEYYAGGAVMITASHNPPEYNGFKFIPAYAGPALPHITKEIEENIRLLNEGRSDLSYREAHSGSRQEIDPRQAYFEHLGRLVAFDAVLRAGLKIVVDPLYGAGIGFLEDILKIAGVRVQVIHNQRDPLFGGTLPEPAGQSLLELSAQVVESGADLGLALDGDADRFGIVDCDGSYLSSNQFLPLVYYHLLAARDLKGPVVRTVATTHLLDRIAGQYGMHVFETPVGFKYIGQHLMEKDCLLGGEESGGLSIRGHVPEKDGMLAGLLAAEIVAFHGRNLGDLLGKVWSRFGRLYSERLDIHTSPGKKEQVLKTLEKMAPAEVAGMKVVGQLAMDGTKMILEDGSWFLVRASGTEPLFRIYVEATEPEKLEKIQQWCRSLLISH